MKDYIDDAIESAYAIIQRMHLVKSLSSNEAQLLNDIIIELETLRHHNKDVLSPYERDIILFGLGRQSIDPTSYQVISGAAERVTSAQKKLTELITKEKINELRNG